MGKMNDRLLDRFLFFGFFIGACFLFYIFGVASVKWKLVPYPALENAFQAGKAVVEKFRKTDIYDSSFFNATRYDGNGVAIYDGDKAFDGVTLFTYGLDRNAVLISMDGKVLHQWHLPFSKAWPDPPHIDAPVEDAAINLIVPYMYNNGDLLGIYATDKDTPFGYGLVKMDKDSNLVWKYPGRAHHDADVDSSGQVYVLTHEMRQEKIPGVRVKPPVMDDYVVVLSADGLEMKKVSITRAFRNSDYAGVLDHLKGWDLWHANNIDVLDGDMAGAFPFLEKGCVLISMKSVNGLAAIDLDREEVIWAVKGPWVGQHDPDFLENGNLLIFDNKGHFGNGGRSRVIEFNPLTMETKWMYAGVPGNVFFSAIRSSQQRLANGNTLITESDTGRMFEVTKAGSIVWDYRIPYRVPDRDRLTAVVLRGMRFKRDELTFVFNNGETLK